ncbi:MAG: hypothetical protein HQL53_00865 [Magnetococcales bacterium]|nr:hypothetical protein [Magnetococcales bacterium]
MILDRVIKRQIIIILLALLLLGGGLVALWSLSNHLWLNGALTLVGLVLFYGVLEYVAERVLEIKFPTLAKRNQSAGLEPRMTPHPFAHFLPSNAYEDVEDHFRLSAPSGSAASGEEGTLYLAGDCTLFEKHLLVEDSLAWQLQTRLPTLKVLNTGAPHYTLYHMTHRLIFDLNRNIRPERMLLFLSVNDFLVFVNHHEGRFSPNYEHFYRPYGLLQELPIMDKVRSSLFRLILGVSIGGFLGDNYDHFCVDVAEDFYTEESIQTARALFDQNRHLFRESLLRFIKLCRLNHIELSLVTFHCNEEDMKNEPRSTYLRGIKAQQEDAKKLADEYGLSWIDLDDVTFEEGDIVSKWQYTGSGNLKRADHIVAHLANR